MNPKLPLQPTPLLNKISIYSAVGAWVYVDAAGAVYRETISNEADGTWGIHVWRAEAGEAPELLLFVPSVLGGMVIYGRRLYVCWEDTDGNQFYQMIPSFIHPQDNQELSQIARSHRYAFQLDYFTLPKSQDIIWP
jgi:hypothetical protein